MYSKINKFKFSSLKIAKIGIDQLRDQITEIENKMKQSEKDYNDPCSHWFDFESKLSEFDWALTSNLVMDTYENTVKLIEEKIIMSKPLNEIFTDFLAMQEKFNCKAGIYENRQYFTSNKILNKENQKIIGHVLVFKNLYFGNLNFY